MRQNAWESPNETYSRNEPSPSGLFATNDWNETL